MKILLNLCLMSSLVLGQELHFSLYPDTDQSFPVPFDTTFRHYPVPYDLLETGTDQLLELVFSACEEMTFCLDDIRFPNNGLIDFEVAESELSFSAGVLSVQRIQHPADTGYVLQLTLDPNHTGTDTLWVEAPENSFPVIPDYVGIIVQSNASVNLWNYVPLRDYRPLWSTIRYRSSHPDWDYNILIETIYSSVTSYDSIVNSTLRWQYSDELNNEVGLDARSYTYRYHDPQKVSIDNVSFDFELGQGVHSGNDSTGGVTLVWEQYENILGNPTFVKQYSPDGLIGSNLYFGYDVGVVREDFAGTSVHDDLVGVRSYDDVQGDFDQDVSLSIGIDQDFPVLATFPPDSNWYHYIIPVSKLYYPEYAFSRSADSVLLTMEPQILVDDHTGLLQFANVQLKHPDGDVLYDFTQEGISGWMRYGALNGSWITIDGTADVPPDDSGPSFELAFDNDMSGSTHFRGGVTYQAYFVPTLQIDPEMTVQFWMRQSPLITGIDDILELPEQVGVTAAYPNPFNGQVTLSIDVPVEMVEPQLVIYDLQGREVWSQSAHTQKHDKYSWDGKNLSGQKMDSGLYIVTLQSGGQSLGQSQKIIMLK